MYRETLLVISSLALITACSAPTSDDASQSATQTSGDDAGLPLWTKVNPGGETSCSDGSDFFLMTHKGDPEKLLFFLEGGGGCSESQSCDPLGEPTYKITLHGQSDPDTGIFDLDQPDNPFSDYSMVYVPYCTGDVHLGLNDTEYKRENGTVFTIRHRGAANVMASLEHTYETFPDARTIFVTGASAGAIPTPFYASYLADHYSEADIAALGDGAGGYRYASPVESQLTRWGIFNHVNLAPGFEDLTPETWSFEQLYIEAGTAFPEMALGRFDFAMDAAQSWFLGTNSQHETLMENILANNADIAEAVPRFRAFIAGSDNHVVIQRPGFYELSANGHALSDWLARFAALEPVENVICETCATAEGLTAE